MGTFDTSSTNPFDVDRVWFRCGCLAMGKRATDDAVLVDAFMGVCTRHRRQVERIPGPLAIFRRRVAAGRSDQLFDASGEPLERLGICDLKTVRSARGAR